LTSSAGGTFTPVGNAWAETGVTWNNQPAAAGSAVGSLGSVTAGGTYEVDVTSLITGDGTFSVRISMTSTAGTGYGARESSTSSQRPQLIVELN
jgi:hypothetical protein